MQIRVKKHVRQLIAMPALQPLYRVLHRVALAGMNYGGAGSASSSGDGVAFDFLARSDAPRPLTVFDVGANVGQYTRLLLGRFGEEVRVWSFEPARVGFEALTRKFSASPQVTLVHGAVAETAGRTTLFNDKSGSVHGSIFANPLGLGAGGQAGAEEVTTLTLDDFCREQGIARIDLLKLDVEGGELAALRGARGLLERGAIRLIQFEFGQPSIGSKVNFYDLWNLLESRFRLYRILPHGLAAIDAYHESLEVYMSTNYLAVARTA